MKPLAQSHRASGGAGLQPRRLILGWACALLPANTKVLLGMVAGQSLAGGSKGTHLYPF